MLYYSALMNKSHQFPQNLSISPYSFVQFTFFASFMFFSSHHDDHYDIYASCFTRRPTERTCYSRSMSAQSHSVVLGFVAYLCGAVYRSLGVSLLPGKVHSSYFSSFRPIPSSVFI